MQWWFLDVMLAFYAMRCSWLTWTFSSEVFHSGLNGWWNCNSDEFRVRDGLSQLPWWSPQDICLSCRQRSSLPRWLPGLQPLHQTRVPLVVVVWCVARLRCPKPCWPWVSLSVRRTIECSCLCLIDYLWPWIACLRIARLWYHDEYSFSRMSIR